MVAMPRDAAGIRRNADGSLEIDHYRRKARRLHALARLRTRRALRDRSLRLIAALRGCIEALRPVGMVAWVRGR